MEVAYSIWSQIVCPVFHVLASKQSNASNTNKNIRAMSIGLKLTALTRFSLFWLPSWKRTPFWQLALCIFAIEDLGGQDWFQPAFYMFLSFSWQFTFNNMMIFRFKSSFEFLMLINRISTLVAFQRNYVEQVLTNRRTRSYFSWGRVSMEYHQKLKDFSTFWGQLGLLAIWWRVWLVLC